MSLTKTVRKSRQKKGNDYKSHKVYATDWDDKGNVEKWRALWADIETDFYRKNGYEITAEHRSFERQGIDLLPTIHMGAAVTAMERRGIRTEVGKMNREIKKINALIISGMENVERLTEKINYLEKAKKAIEQEESKETAGNEILLKILKEEPDTIMSFLQSHKIETLDDLHRLAEKTKKKRSNNIHRQHELNAKLKKHSNIVDIYNAYKPFAETLKKYESLSGRQKRSYYDKNADRIETALTYRTGLKTLSGSEKFLHQTWKKDLDAMKAESAKIRHDLVENDTMLGEFAEIADKVAMVQREEQGKTERNTSRS